MNDQLGTLEERDGQLQLRFTRRYAHPPQKVFRALTEPEHLRAWFPTDVIGERKAGAPLKFEFREGEAAPFNGEFLAYEPPQLVEYQWGPDDVLRFELQPDGDGTLLVFVNTFTPLGKAARDAAGWHQCLDALAYELDGATPPWAGQDRWRQVHGSYVARFPAAASTVGAPGGKNV